MKLIIIQKLSIITEARFQLSNNEYKIIKDPIALSIENEIFLVFNLFICKRKYATTTKKTPIEPIISAIVNSNIINLIDFL
jgi:hypothetical protein